MPSPCPSAAELAALLKGNLEQSGSVWLEQHLKECPACREQLDVLAGGKETWLKQLARSGDATQIVRAGSAPQSASHLGPVPGQLFGSYVIVRLLGQGGMGTVYEAEEQSSGRRVALKVLSHGLESPRARQRFLREGRLAASIYHPNSVYIYGTEEIYGTPVIVMEFIAGGSLSDQLDANPPRSPGDAVDAILQVIDGLESAWAKGVLHRDIKPSNCFVELDGTIKVGDYGLSISTLARDQTKLTIAGAVMGTPAYASPEQLRGDELDVRSDIYSVGATLFHLLTGSPPFKSENVIHLVASVLEQAVPSPHELRPEVPQQLAGVVLRCLAKRPEERFKTYQELRQALQPFASASPIPAPLNLRLAAGLIDFLLIKLAQGFPIQTFLSAAILFITASGWLWPGLGFGINTLYFALYFALSEAFWGASPGKWLCGLRVVGIGRGRPSLVSALGRAVIFLGAFTVVERVMSVFELASPQLSAHADRTSFYELEQGTVKPVTVRIYDFRVALGPLSVALGLLFLAARRRNGFAGLHDLITGTRVIEKSSAQVRPRIADDAELMPDVRGIATVGPYHLLGTLWQRDGTELCLGYDPRLLRKVWIHRRSSGSAAVPAERRQLARKGRLRWLAGHYSETGCWDAYTALEGQPFLRLVKARQPWGSVRFWLHDLAEELVAGEATTTQRVVLGLDRVWITSDGRSVLLDFPAPEIDAKTVGDRVSAFRETEAISFLQQVAATALGGSVTGNDDAFVHPSSIAARHALGFVWEHLDLVEVVRQLKSLLDKPAAVSAAQRVRLLASYAVPTGLLLSLDVFLSVHMSRFANVPKDDIFQSFFWPELVFISGLNLLTSLGGRGPLLRAFRIDVVTRKGLPAGRWRAFLRSQFAWLPFFLLAMTWAPTPWFEWARWSLLALILFGVFFAVLRPERSLPDRLAGTWLVPEITSDRQASAVRSFFAWIRKLWTPT